MFFIVYFYANEKISYFAVKRTHQTDFYFYYTFTRNICDVYKLFIFWAADFVI